MGFGKREREFLDVKASLELTMSLCVCVCVCLYQLASRGQYLSQMMSDLHETFRISSWGSPKMIQDFKDDLILQVSSQEPSASSKYDFEDGGFLTHLYSC